MKYYQDDHAKHLDFQTLPALPSESLSPLIDSSFNEFLNRMVDSCSMADSFIQNCNEHAQFKVTDTLDN